MEPVRPHQISIQPGTLFSYAMFSLEEGVWKHFEDRWLVVEVCAEVARTCSATAAAAWAGVPSYSITALNQWGRLNRTHLYPTDRIVVHCG